VLPPLTRPLGENAETSYTLSADFYLDPRVYESEKHGIFYRSWQYLAPECQFRETGDYATLRICDENVFAIRDDKGELRAFYNVCRHRAHELLSGAGNSRNLIVCPYHAWSYDNRGKLVRAPLSEGRADFAPGDFCLRPVRLEVFCGCVFVNLDDDAEPLGEIAADLEGDIRAHLPFFDRLRPSNDIQPAVQPIEAGWKVVVDNYVECYHCRPAHPDFASIIDMDSYQTELRPLWSRQYGPRIRADNSAYPVDPETGYQQSVFWYLWPNTTFNVMPGPEAVGIYAVRPYHAGSSAFEGHTLSAGGKPHPPRSRYINEILGPEDVRLCESVQRGLRSRSYDQGVYIVDRERPGESEHALHHFHRLVLRALSDDEQGSVQVD
jgi:choline monooxygenase